MFDRSVRSLDGTETLDTSAEGVWQLNWASLWSNDSLRPDFGCTLGYETGSQWWTSVRSLELLVEVVRVAAILGMLKILLFFLLKRLLGWPLFTMPIGASAPTRKPGSMHVAATLNSPNLAVRVCCSLTVTLQKATRTHTHTHTYT